MSEPMKDIPIGIVMEEIGTGVPCVTYEVLTSKGPLWTHNQSSVVWFRDKEFGVQQIDIQHLADAIRERCAG